MTGTASWSWGSRLGLISLWKQAWFDFAGTLHPLWKLMYAVRWRLHGPDPFWWHVENLTIHAVSAVALWSLCRRYLSPAAAWLAAAAWAAAAIGRWDNPLIWIWAGAFATGVTGIVALAYSDVSPSHRLRWLFLAGLLFGLLNWSIILTLAAAIPLQYYWLERPRGAPPAADRRAWRLTFLVPFCAMSLIQVAYAVLRMSQQVEWTSRSGASWFEYAAAVHANALATLLGLESLGHVVDNLPFKLALAGALLLSLILAPKSTWRLVLLFQVAAIVYLMATNLRPRGGIDLGREYAGGRYAYISTLAWCVSLAGLVETLMARLGNWARAPLNFAVAAAELAPDDLNRVATVLRNSKNERAPLWLQSVDAAPRVDHALRFLDGVGRAHQEEIELPAIPLNDHFAAFPAWRVVWYQLRDIEHLAANRTMNSPHERLLRASELLRAHDTAEAAQWRAIYADLLQGAPAAQ